MVNLSKDHPQKVVDLGRNHIQKVMDLSRDHVHKVMDLSRDHLHEMVNLRRDHPHQSNFVITILPHFLLKDITDHHPQDMDHKDLPKAHQPSNLEFNDSPELRTFSEQFQRPPEGPGTPLTRPHHNGANLDGEPQLIPPPQDGEPQQSPPPRDDGPQQGPPPPDGEPPQGPPRPSTVVITILSHPLLRGITDDHPRGMIHKDLPTAHHPRNLEVKNMNLQVFQKAMEDGNLSSIYQ
ncbi:hypothetical protein E5288_WYG013664 [Bos mutus]|uniref:Uncharacterized protein n=1 Tax=Bos mutus TaxID=72004 RepID=A0A6B0QQU4_9CETA|nr:hypothetical protein [Bos mutus]